VLRESSIPLISTTERVASAALFVPEPSAFERLFERASTALAPAAPTIAGAFTAQENGSEPVKGPDAYAIRSHAFFRLRDRRPEIESVAEAFTSEAPPARSRKRGYSIEGATLLAAR